MGVDAYLAGLQVGQGANTGQRTTHGFAVNGHIKVAVPEAPGLEKNFQLTVLSDRQSIVRALSISAELSYASVFSVSAAAEFLSTSSYSRYRTYVLARCVVSLPDKTLEQPTLKPEAKEEAKTLTPAQFQQVYGTEFLSGIRTGGAYYGVIEIESTSSSEQERIAVAVSAAGWGASASVSVSKSLEMVTEGLSKRVFVLAGGVPASMPNPTSPDEIIKQAVSFPAVAAGTPIIVQGIYQPYDQAFLIEYKAGGGEFDTAKRNADLQLLGQRYVRLHQLRNDFDYVIRHYNDHVRGSGVVFQVAGETLHKQSLMSLTAETLRQLPVETDTDTVTALPPSKEITPDSLSAEIIRIEEALVAVIAAADRCKQGKEYSIPAPYLAQVGLPAIKGKNMELELMKKQLVPAGTIVMWSGPIEAIPEGWALCNGTNGTQNLTDRFIRGAGNGAADPRPLTSGEATEHSHHVNPESITAQTDDGGEHTHRFPGGWYHRGLDSGGYSGIDTGNDHISGEQRVQPGGTHHHSVKVDLREVITKDTLGTIMPRWFALCFIQKL